jgi:hypothetical protein
VANSAHAKTLDKVCELPWWETMLKKFKVYRASHNTTNSQSRGNDDINDDDSEHDDDEDDEDNEDDEDDEEVGAVFEGCGPVSS